MITKRYSVTGCDVCHERSFNYVIMNKRAGRMPRVLAICRHCVLGKPEKYGRWQVLAVRGGNGSAYAQAFKDAIKEFCLHTHCDTPITETLRTLPNV